MSRFLRCSNPKSKAADNKILICATVLRKPHRHFLALLKTYSCHSYHLSQSSCMGNCNCRLSTDRIPRTTSSMCHPRFSHLDANCCLPTRDNPLFRPVISAFFLVTSLRGSPLQKSPRCSVPFLSPSPFYCPSSKTSQKHCSSFFCQTCLPGGGVVSELLWRWRVPSDLLASPAARGPPPAYPGIHREMGRGSPVPDARVPLHSGAADGIGD